MKTAAPNSNKKSKSKPKKSAKKCVKTTKAPQKTISKPQTTTPELPITAQTPLKTNPEPKLKRKQQIFVAEYLVDLDATKAAIRAGYSKKSAYAIGAENLRKPPIKAAIDAEIEKRKADCGGRAERVIAELELLGFSDMGDFVEIDEGGAVRAFPLGTLAEGKSRIIRKVKEKRTIKSTAEGDQILESTYEFELYDKVKPLETLARHHGLLHDKQELDVKQPITFVTKDFYMDKDGEVKEKPHVA
ncbi:MAG: terminase small subunit [Pseudomonadota bacterium]